MLKDIHITLIQTELFWEQKKANFELLEKKIQQSPKETDIIVLPEMFSTGFSMNTKILAEKMDGESIQKILFWAKNYGKVIVGSLIIEENQHYFNRLIWVDSDGKIQFYDKKHLFTYAGENQFYNAGTESLIVEFKGWKIACFICFDLRFPEWSRNTNTKYDVAIYVANWPESRSQAWKSLLPARAVENQCYVIGVNRVGIDGKGNSYSGDSCIINPFGNSLIAAKSYKNEIIYTELNWEILQEYRTKFPVLNDIKP